MTPLEMHDILANTGHLEIEHQDIHFGFGSAYQYEYSVSLHSFHNGNIWIDTSYGMTEEEAVIKLYESVKDQTWCMCEYIENELRR